MYKSSFVLHLSVRPARCAPCPRASSSRTSLRSCIIRSTHAYGAETTSGSSGTSHEHPFHRREAYKTKTRTFIEGYHFGPLWSRRKVVRFNADVPVNETPTNIRYVDIKSKFGRTGTSLRVHESRVHIGEDMFLVSGYWDPKADVNRSVFSAMRIIWRGEISVIRAGRYIPYHKRMKDGRKADLAVKRYVRSFTIPSVWALTVSGSFAEVFKHRRTSRRLVPRTIL